MGWSESCADGGLDRELNERRDTFTRAMDDDLNTSAALAVLFELARPLRALANRLERGDDIGIADAEIERRWRLLVELAGVLGLNAETVAAIHGERNNVGPSDERIQELIEQRRCAKAARDYATADSLRDELRSHGIELIDRPTGSTDWLRK
jgi:cysteinyl-tRNA synthetase